MKKCYSLSKAITFTALFLFLILQPEISYCQTLPSDITLNNHDGGWCGAFFIQGNYAYLVQGPTIAIGDVSGNQFIKKNAIMLSYEPEDVFSAGNYLYLISGAGKKLTIYGLTNPEIPSFISEFAIPGASSLRQIFVSGNYAYLTRSLLGVEIVNISNPAVPVFVRTFTPLISKIFVSGNYAYCLVSEGGTYKFKTYNLTDINNIQETSSINQTNPVNIFVNENYAYISGTGLNIYHLTNPAQPVFSGSTDVSSIKLNKIWVWNNYAYTEDVTDYHWASQKLRIYNVSNPSAPVFAGTSGNLSSFTDLKAFNNKACVTNGGNFYIFNTSNPSALTSQIFLSPTDISSIFVNGNNMYVGDVTGIFTYNISNPSNIQLTHYYDEWGSVGKVYVKGTNLYSLGSWSKDLTVINISNPDNPQQSGSYTETGGQTFLDITITGNTCYISKLMTSNTGTLVVLNVTNPSSPVKIRSIDLAGSPKGMFLSESDHFLYLTYYKSDSDRGFQIFNIENPANPILVKTQTMNSSPAAISLDGNFAFITSNTTTNWVLSVYDISNKNNPVLKTSATETGSFWDLKIMDGVILASSPSSGLKIFVYDSAQNQLVAGPTANLIMAADLVIYKPSSYNSEKKIPGKSFSNLSQQSNENLYYSVIQGYTSYTEGYLSGSGGRYDGEIPFLVRPIPTLTLGGGKGLLMHCPITASIDSMPHQIIDTVFNFSLSADEYDDWQVGSIKFQASGTGLDNQYIKEVKLYMRPSTLLSTGKYTDDNGFITLGINKTIARSETKSFFVVYVFEEHIGIHDTMYTYSIKTKMPWVTANALTYPTYLKLPPETEFSGGPVLVALVFNQRTMVGYGRIQDAINDQLTINSDTILVCPCQLNEDVSVTKELSIRSIAGKHFTYVRGNNTAFTVRRSKVLIDGFTISTSLIQNKTGVYIIGNSPIKECKITNNDIKENYNAIIFEGDVDTSVITNNRIYSNKSAGILFRNGPHRNWIGGRINAQSDKNLIFDNKGPGISFIDSDSNVVSKNDICPSSANDTTANIIGIELQESNHNYIWGSKISKNSGAGISIKDCNNNEINGNEILKNYNYGVLIFSENDSCSENTITSNNIEENDIGAGLYGSNTKRNKLGDNTITKSTNEGIYVSGGATQNGIGGEPRKTTPGDTIGSAWSMGNFIYNNTGAGILIRESNLNFIYHNEIGFKTELNYDVNPFPNKNGIEIINANGNEIKNNQISGNLKNGILIDGSEVNIISLCYIGICKGPNNRNKGVANGEHGIWLKNSPNNLIGSGSGADNHIGYNKLDGIHLSGSLTRNNIIQNNWIGLGFITSTDYTNFIFPNKGNGLSIEDGASFNFIGDSIPVGKNRICGNLKNGILLKNNADQNKIYINLIGTNDEGQLLPNRGDGINITSCARNEIKGNVVSGNSGNGIYSTMSSHNTITGNFIGTDKNGEMLIPNEYGIKIEDQFSKIENNIISGNNLSGMYISGLSTHLTVKGNLIGIGKNGNSALPNKHNGIEIHSWDNNIENNIVSGNLEAGIYLSEDTKRTVIKGNMIGTDYWGTFSIPNKTGILIDGGRTENIIIGSTNTGERNIISGNREAGIKLNNTGSITILGNHIGLSSSGTALPNYGCGIYMTGSSANNNILKNNIIKFNMKDGICAENYVQRPPLNIIDNNNISNNNLNGISLCNAFGFEIKQNNILHNTKAGINLLTANLIVVYNNTITDNGTGIKIVDCPFLNDEIITANNNISGNHGATGIHLTNSRALISGNIIKDDLTDGIRCEYGSYASIINNSIFNNSGFGLINTDSSVTIDAEGNWWGNISGPGGTGSGGGDEVQGNVTFSNWLTKEVSVVVSAIEDSVFTPENTTDSVKILFNNMKNPGDNLIVQIADEKQWILPPFQFTTNLADSIGTSATIKFSTAANAVNKITVTASSFSNSNDADTVSIVVLAYNPQLDTLILNPDSATIAAGDSVQLFASGKDQYLKTIEIIPVWHTNLGEISTTGLFKCNSEGTVLITVTDSLSGKQAHTNIFTTQQTPRLVRVEIKPDTVILNTRQAYLFEAKGYNQFGFPHPVAVKWSCDEGLINNYGLFTADNVPRSCLITAEDTLTGIKGTAVAIKSGIIPVELSSFTACQSEKQILLNWTTITETNNLGFDIERQIKSLAADSLKLAAKGNNSGWEKIGFIKGHGSVAESYNYNFTDNSIQHIGIYKYRLKQIDQNGTYTYSEELEVEFTIRSFSLDQNYPNPFNPSTTISFGLPVTSKVTLEVYNILGERIATLMNEIKEAGYHRVSWKPTGLSSGIYIYRVFAKAEDNSGNFTAVKKMLLLK